MSRRSIRPFFTRAFTAALLLLACLATPALSQQPPAPAEPSLQARQVAAPPADILSGRVRLPAPQDVAIRSGSAMLPVRFALGPDGRGVFEADVPVEAPGDLALVPFSPDIARWSLAVARPDAAAGSSPVALETLVARGEASARSGTLDELDPAVFATRWDLHTDASSGSWRIRIERPEPDDAVTRPAGWLLVGSGGAARLVSHLTTHRLVEGERIGVVAALEDGTADPAAQVRLLAAALDAETPIGPLNLEMLDDGRHADGAAGDGVFGAWLPHLPPGEVFARVVARGAAADGHAVLRTVQHAFPILPHTAMLAGVVTASPEPGRIALDVGVLLQDAGPAAASAGKLHVSAEVWAAGTSGEPAAVCWLSTMASLDAAPAAPAGQTGSAALRLALDARWLPLAGAAPPLELRALRLQDPDTHIVFDTLDRVAVQAPSGGWDTVVPQGAAPLGAPTRDMLMGAAATVSSPGVTDDSPSSGPSLAPRRDPALMLVHGYCSSGGVWPQADFSQPKLTFLDANQNRSHDQFALLIAATGAAKRSFGVVAHSQGGAAALHLYTFYVSGLDQAHGARLIQSVATPYAGTPLAGNLAVLGQIFGSGCGENFDMSESGAALWLSTIPTWARDKVHYWTTSDGGSACNFLTNFFLSNPEDGVVEKDLGQLPGAHSMGHKNGWCHTTGMTYSANYTDHVRNAEMNAAAAR